MQETTGFYRLPPGCKFCPSDEELLGYFLYMRVTRMVLPADYDTLIMDCDLYGELEPWQIGELYKGQSLVLYDKYGGTEEEEAEEKDMFFFTQLKKSIHGSRINRKVGLGSGAWQGEDAAKKVLSSGRVLGFKKRFRYENKGCCEHNGGWIMHEYSIDSSLLGAHHVNDYVLCRVRRNVHGKRKNTGLHSRKKRKLNRHEEGNKVNVDDQEQKGFEIVDYEDSESWLLDYMTSNFLSVDYHPHV